MAFIHAIKRPYSFVYRQNYGGTSLRIYCWSYAIETWGTTSFSRRSGFKVKPLSFIHGTFLDLNTAKRSWVFFVSEKNFNSEMTRRAPLYDGVVIVEAVNNLCPFLTLAGNREMRGVYSYAPRPKERRKISNVLGRSRISAPSIHIVIQEECWESRKWWPPPLPQLSYGLENDDTNLLSCVMWISHAVCYILPEIRSENSKMDWNRCSYDIRSQQTVQNMTNG